MASKKDSGIIDDAPFEGFEERFYLLLETAELNPRENFSKTCDLLGINRSLLYHWFSSEAPPIMSVRDAVVSLIETLKLPWDVNTCLAYLYFGADEKLNPAQLNLAESHHETPMVSEVMRCTVYLATVAGQQGLDISAISDQQFIDILKRVRIYCSSRNTTLRSVLRDPPRDFSRLIKNQLKLADLKAL